jgi:hypothetical protein
MPTNIKQIPISDIKATINILRCNALKYIAESPTVDQAFGDQCAYINRLSGLLLLFVEDHQISKLVASAQDDIRGAFNARVLALDILASLPAITQAGIVQGVA